MSTRSKALMHLRDLDQRWLAGKPLPALAEELLETALLLQEGREDIPQAANAIGQLRSAMAILVRVAQTPDDDVEALQYHNRMFLRRIKSVQTLVGTSMPSGDYPEFAEWVFKEFPEPGRWGVLENTWDMPWPDGAVLPPTRILSRVPGRFRSWREVLAATWDEVLAMKNIGNGSLVELRAAFQGVGLYWPEEGIPIRKPVDETLYG